MAFRNISGDVDAMAHAGTTILNAGIQRCRLLLVLVLLLLVVLLLFVLVDDGEEGEVEEEGGERKMSFHILYNAS